MIVSVHAIFSHNHMIGSKIIANGTAHLAPRMNVKASHTAVLVNERWVHESTGHSGVRVISYDLWKQINIEVGRIKLADREYQELADLYRKIKDKKYDYPGIAYFSLAIIPTFIGIKLPEKNKWESPNKYFCCEVLGYLTGHYYGMSSPIQILDKLTHG
jgi:hypothetical protein